jgi:hypothetical protein
MRAIVKYTSAIYRTLPGLLNYSFFVVLYTLMFSLSLMVIFDDYLYEFSSYENSLINSSLLNLYEINEIYKDILIG